VTVPEPGVIGVKEYERLEPRPKDVLLRIEMTGVCGTDPHIIFDEKPLPWITAKFYPFIPGHEFIARIEEVGSDFPRVDPDGEPIKVGDLVGVSVEDMDSSPCGRCYNCATHSPYFVHNVFPRIIRFWKRAGREDGRSSDTRTERRRSINYLRIYHWRPQSLLNLFRLR